MANPTAIESFTISGDLYSKQDEIWVGEALPNATTKLSDAFKLGQTMAGVEVKVVCSTAGTATAAIQIDLQTSATSGGTYTTQVSKTQALGAIAAGDELARLILPKEVEDELYAKILITTTADESAIDVDAYLVPVA